MPTYPHFDATCSSDFFIRPGVKQRRDFIVIPPAAQGRPLAGLGLSARLRSLFGLKKLRVLGDLHGLRLSAFSSFRNCGPKTMKELRLLVYSVQGNCASRDPKTTAAATALPIQAGRFFVPQAAHGLNPFALPVSGPLKRVLREKGITRLGDLHALLVSDILNPPRCRWKTTYTLVCLLERVIADEFALRTTAFSTVQARELLP